MEELNEQVWSREDSDLVDDLRNRGYYVKVHFTDDCSYSSVAVRDKRFNNVICECDTVTEAYDYVEIHEDHETHRLQKILANHQ